VTYPIITRVPWGICSYKPVHVAASIRRGKHNVERDDSSLEGSIFDVKSLSNLDVFSDANYYPPFNWMVRLVLFASLFVDIIVEKGKGVA
jgi:hypothetical protein